MAITPFYRLIRYSKKTSFSSFVNRPDFAPNAINSISAYYVIEQDLKKLFEYIDPRDANLTAHSLRTFELLLRIATEFESNCKAILCANKYAKGRSDRMDITDYRKVDSATKLSEYEIALNVWHPGRKIMRPLAEWKDGRPLPWYQDYNTVKHNRSEEFALATFDNVVTGVASLFAVLFAQFGEAVFDPYQETSMLNGDKHISVPGSLFAVSPYRDWDVAELYDNTVDLQAPKFHFERYDFDIV